MKPKIVIKVCMNCDRARYKAMKVTAETRAISMAIEGNDLNQLVVTGEGINSVFLTTTLRKKVGDPTILMLEEVKPGWCCPPPPPPPPPYPCAPYPYCGVVCDQEPSYCAIM